MTRKVKSVDYQTQEEKRRTLYFEPPPPFLVFTPVKDMTMYLATTFGRAVDKLTKQLSEHKMEVIQMWKNHQDEV